MSEWLAKHLGHVVLATAVLAIGLAAITVALVVNQKQTSDQVTEITRVVHKATCGGGHEPANLAACHRLCPNLSTISDIHCDVAKGVAAQNGNTNSPSQQPGPSGGQRQPHSPESPQEPSSPPPNTSSPQPLPEVTKPVCTLTGSLNLPVCH